MHLDLIVGLPLDYWNDIKFSFEEVFKLFPPELQLGFLKFLKGTPVRDKHQDHGYVFDPVAPYQIIRSNYLSEKELADITLLEHALEIYWNKPRLYHTLKYVTAQYSIFDFLLGLGRQFQLKHGRFIGFSLETVYEIAAGFIESSYPNDPVLKELLAIDHWLQHKIKPSKSFLQEFDKKEKFALLDAYKLPHNKFRFAVTPISFDFGLWERENTIAASPTVLVIAYDGQTKARVLDLSALEIA